MVSGLQSFPKPFEGDGLVPVLATFFPAEGHDAGGKVDQANSAFGSVLMLTALSAGCEGLDTTLGKEFFVRFRDGEGVGKGIVGRHDPNVSKYQGIRYGKGEGRSIMFGGTQ